MTSELRQIKPFQRDGVDFLKRVCPSGNPHKILADDTGTGKTVQCAVAIKELTDEIVCYQQYGAEDELPFNLETIWKTGATALIVCPKSVKTTWRRQLIDWGATQSKCVFIVESSKDVIPTWAQFIIVNYELAIKKPIYEQLYKRWFSFLICDEAQRFRNFDSQTTDIFLRNQGKGKPGPLVARGYYKWYLSATIMPDRALQMYPILRVNFPEVISPHLTKEAFGMHYCDGRIEVVEAGGKVLNVHFDFSGSSNLDELRERLIKCDAFLRRRLRDVWEDMPDIIERELFFDIGELEVDETCAPIASVYAEVGRKKLPHVLQYLRDRLSDYPDRKIVVFTFHTEVSEGIRDGIENAVAIFGKTSDKQREFSKHQFINNPICKVIAVQYQSGAEAMDGLHLAAYDLVAAELDWSVGTTVQADGRVIRINQPSDKIYLHRCIAEGTLDEAMRGSFYGKKKSVNKLLDKKQEKLEMSIETELSTMNATLLAVKGLLEKLAGTAGSTTEKPADKPEAAKDKPPAAKSGKGKTDKAKEEASATLDDLEAAVQATFDKFPQTEAGEEAARVKLKKAISELGFEALADITSDRYADAINAFQAITADAGKSRGI